MKRMLDPKNRARLRELVDGFIQHCEISRSLLGRIDRFVERDGIKYGVPVFNFYGPPHEALETSFVGLIARNEGSEKSASETILQFLERLVLQPSLASGLVVKAMPVSNPVALETDREAPAAHELPDLADHLAEFMAQELDGLITVAIGDIERPHVEARGPDYIRQSAARAVESIDGLSRELPSGGFECRLALQGAPAGAWNLFITAPRSWPDSVVTQWVSQFLVVFLRRRSEALQVRSVPLSKNGNYADL